MEKTKQLHDEKSRIQEKVVSLALCNQRSFIAMCTGSGKTKVGIDYCSILSEDIGTAEFRILWVVPTEKLRDVTVKDEFYKWGHEELYENEVETVCYASLNKYENEFFDIVILDEAHRITPNNFEFFYKNDVLNILALSATPPHEEEKKELFRELGVEIIYNLSLDEGVDMGVVAPYKVHVIYTNLNDIDSDVQVKVGNKTYDTTEVDRYKALSAVVDSIRNQMRMYGDTPQRKRQFKFAALNRMRFIYNLNSKTQYASMMIDHLKQEFPDDRTLVFCGSIKQCEYLLENDVFHSKTNDEQFNKFINKEINMLGVVKSVNEGHNIPDLDRAIIVQLDSNPRNTIQRIGRMVRKRPGHQAEIFVFVAKNTQDEVWCDKALGGLDNVNIEYHDIDLVLDDTLSYSILNEFDQ